MTGTRGISWRCRRQVRHLQFPDTFQEGSWCGGVTSAVAQIEKCGHVFSRIRDTVLGDRTGTGAAEVGPRASSAVRGTLGLTEPLATSLRGLWVSGNPSSWQWCTEEKGDDPRTDQTASGLPHNPWAGNPKRRFLVTDDGNKRKRYSDQRG